MRPSILATVLTLAIAPSALAQSLVRPADYPSVDFGRLEPGDPVPGQPGATFTHTGLGWAITPAPILPAVQLPTPPTADEWETTTDSYGGYPLTSLRRTADPSQWFVLGQEYTHPYSYRMRPLTVSRSSVDGRWYVVSEITRTGGVPALGTILRTELYAPRGPWFPVLP
jgi:hypothetical protein